MQKASATRHNLDSTVLHLYCRRSMCTAWPAAMRRANRGLSRPWAGAWPRCWGCAGLAMSGGSCIGSPASTANLRGPRILIDVSNRSGLQGVQQEISSRADDKAGLRGTSWPAATMLTVDMHRSGPVPFQSLIAGI